MSSPAVEQDDTQAETKMEISNADQPDLHQQQEQTQLTESDVDKEWFHPNVQCDGCGRYPLFGFRYKCTSCEDFDLCRKCLEKKEHPLDHEFYEIEPTHIVVARFKEDDLKPAINQTPKDVSVHQNTVSANINSGSGAQNIAGGSQFNVSGDLHIHGADAGLLSDKKTLVHLVSEEDEEKAAEQAMMQDVIKFHKAFKKNKDMKCNTKYRLSDHSEVPNEPKVEKTLPKEPIIDAEQRLLDNCRQCGVEFHGDIASDGNCLFHAVSDQLVLLGHPSLPANQMRKFVVDFLKFNPVLKGPDGAIDLRTVKPDWGNYLEQMSQDGRWADEIILRAVAHWLKINILVVTSSPQGTGDQIYRWIISNDQYKGEPIRLGHVWEWHYKSLVPFSGSPTLIQPSPASGSPAYQQYQFGLAPCTALSPVSSTLSIHNPLLAVQTVQQGLVQMQAQLDQIKGQHRRNDLQEKLVEWRVMSRELYLCDRKEIRFGRSCEAIADTEDIFVDLELIEEDNIQGRDRNEPLRGRKLQSYQELLTLVDKENKQSFHILLIGNAGSGKTTMISRIAYQWALGIGEDGNCVPEANIPEDLFVPVLSSIELVVVLDVRSFRSDQTLAEAIRRQLLPGVSADEIEKVLTLLGKKCLVLLDGFDEMPRGLKNHALDSPQLPRLFVIVTTRPHMTDKFFRKKRGYCRVQLLGFSRESSFMYIEKYFHNVGKGHLADSLKQAVTDTPILSVLSSFPILLVMMCLLWEVAQRKNISFQSMTRLYKEAVKYINRPFEDREEDDDGGKRRPSLDHILLTLGETALRELFDNTVLIGREEFVDQDVLKQSVAMGLVLESEGKLVDDTSVSFIHKTFQEYCSAVYLCSLMEKDSAKFEEVLNQIQETNVNDMEYLLQFSCGLNYKVAEAVLPHVVNLKGNKKQSARLPLILVHETELSPEAKSLNTKTLHASLDVNMCSELQIGDAVMAAAMSHFTAKTHILARTMWLPKIKSLEAHHKFEKINSVIEILGGITGLQKVQLQIQKLEELQGNLDQMSLTKNESIKELHLDGEHREEVEVSVTALLTFLKCMPSVAEVHLGQVNFLPNLDEDDNDFVNTSVTKFKMLSFGNEDVNANTLIRCLRCMPSLTKVTLKYINLVGMVEPSAPPLSNTVMQFSLSSKGHSTNAVAILGVLKCMRSLKKVFIEGVLLKDEVDCALWTQSAQLAELHLDVREGKGCSIDVRTVLNFVRCFPHLTLFGLNNINMIGSLDEQMLTTPFKTTSCERLMISASISDRYTINLSLLSRFLNCFPEVAQVYLLSVFLEDTDDEHLPLSSSVHQLEVHGLNDKYILSDVSLLRLLPIFPSLDVATFCKVHLTQNLPQENPPHLDLPLKEFNYFGGVPTYNFLYAVLPSCLKILRINFLTSKFSKEEISSIFTNERLSSLETLDLDKTLSNGFSEGTNVIVDSCLSNIHSLYLTNFLESRDECQQLIEVIISKGNSHSIPLQKLCLTNNAIGDSLVDFMHVLRYIPDLEILGLKECGLQVQESQVNKIEQNLVLLTKLTYIELSGNETTSLQPFLSPRCPYLSNLTVLRLADMGITDDIVAKLPFSKLCGLTELDLSKNKITSEGAQTLAKSFIRNHMPQLQDLLLRYNCIGSEGASALAQSLKHLTELKSFHVDKNQSIGMTGLQDIFMALIHLPNLENFGFESITGCDESTHSLLVSTCLKALDIKESESNFVRGDDVKELCRVVNEFLDGQKQS